MSAWFLLVVAVVANLIQGGLLLCGENSGESYRQQLHRGEEHRALCGYSTVTQKAVASHVRCWNRCLITNWCRSINFSRFRGICQLNNASVEDVDVPLVVSCGFVYFGKQLPGFMDPNMMCTTREEGEEHTLDDRGNPCFSRTPLRCCKNPVKLGLENGTIPDENITASSNWNGKDISTPSGGRLNKPDQGPNDVGAWAPSISDIHQWIQVDLGTPTCVHGVLMQGRVEKTNIQWVTRFRVLYRSYPTAMLTHVLDPADDCAVQEFGGNTDGSTAVERLFTEPIVASTVRINPVGWNDHIALRFELLGCRNA